MVSIQYLKVDMLHFLFSSGAKRAKLLLRNRPASQNVIALPVLASAGASKSSESVSCFSFLCSPLPCAGFHTRRAPLLEATDNDEANRLVTTELALMQHKGVARGGAGNTPPGPRPAIIVSPREHGELTPSQMEHSQDSAPVAVLHAGQPEGGNADLQGGMEDRLRGDRWGGVADEMVGLASRQETGQQMKGDGDGEEEHPTLEEAQSQAWAFKNHPVPLFPLYQWTWETWTLSWTLCMSPTSHSHR